MKPHQHRSGAVTQPRTRIFYMHTQIRVKTVVMGLPDGTHRSINHIDTKIRK